MVESKQATSSRTAFVAGDFQTQMGLPGNWLPAHPNTRMHEIGNSTQTLTVQLPAGSYTYKIVLGGKWDVNYGADGEAGGANIPLVLEQESEVTFVFRDDGHERRISAWIGEPDARQLSEASWQELDALCAYDGDDLGAVYADGAVTLKLWAPKADAVTAWFYDKDNAELAIGGLSMQRGDRGVWSVSVDPSSLKVEDMRGYYYQYEVKHGRRSRRVLDPYARSMAIFRVNPAGIPLGSDRDAVGKAAIVDLNRTQPEGGISQAAISGYERREDAIIYEVHVRDFTSDPAVAGDLKARWGSFRAFIDKLDYIRSLGVTHIQLLPIMAWYYGDEAAMATRELEPSTFNNQYNWGYDPHGYFAPDGAYSENPADPELRIREFKELVSAIHEAGMGVILDVVYTHMAKHWLLTDIVPGYYFWEDAGGKLVGGFGSNLATNHKMAEKLMIDSVVYWFKEFKIDGMRWDMMGDATYPAVQRAYDAAREVCPRALFIGEGWRTFAGHLAEPALRGMAADQDWMDKTDDVGVFSDEFRDELKGGFGNEGEPRFLTGGARSIWRLFHNVKAQPSNTPADTPGDMVQYLEAHDNLTLHDVIALTLQVDPTEAKAEREIHRRIRLGQVLLLTAQGTAFLHAGQEYGRTKRWEGSGPPASQAHTLYDRLGEPLGYFIHNSYDSSDAINRFDWGKATDARKYPVHAATKRYTEGLIRLRRSTDAFRLPTRELVDRNVTWLGIPEIGHHDLVIAYRCQPSEGKDAYYIFVNADTHERALSLGEDLTAGNVLVDGERAGVEAIGKPSGFVLTRRRIVLQPLTAVVIRMAGGGHGKRLV
ncbi:alpha-amylase family glycosyl hydrolase [Paenibacillus daejeonensis]|uniref:pullulanase X25 domain-containing protein n=1 Tax=Paenibacillus daejeonensis TaxID=135193 RepID=UPI00035C83DC